MLRLDDIGFYTLREDRCKNASSTSQVSRLEIIITDKCNFKCAYCRGLRDDISGVASADDVFSWIKQCPTKAIRFSGGEPTTHPDLCRFVRFAKQQGTEKVAISTNGSAAPDMYRRLVLEGCNDFSVSLDACCASFCDRMSGVDGYFDAIVSNIKMLSALTYVTVGVVVTEESAPHLAEIVKFADGCGVADIRIISAAQWDKKLDIEGIPEEVLDRHPILKFRVMNLKWGIKERGLSDADSHKCGLVLDDLQVAGGYHFPCPVYMRERGEPIGKVMDADFRAKRLEWYEKHNSLTDPICRKNCIDFCACYNARFEDYRK